MPATKYYRKKKAQYQAESKVWRDANKERHRKYSNDYRLENIREYRASKKKHAQENPEIYAARNAERRATKLNATPEWLSKEHKKQIRDFYVIAKELSWLSESPLEVDHVIPLKGKTVSGLHVPWNLQILPKSLNCKKHNKLVS